MAGINQGGKCVPLAFSQTEPDSAEFDKPASNWRKTGGFYVEGNKNKIRKLIALHGQSGVM